MSVATACHCSLFAEMSCRTRDHPVRHLPVGPLLPNAVRAVKSEQGSEGRVGLGAVEWPRHGVALQQGSDGQVGVGPVPAAPSALPVVDGVRVAGVLTAGSKEGRGSTDLMRT